MEESGKSGDWERLGSRSLGSHFVFSLRYDRYRLHPRAGEADAARQQVREREFVVIESRDWVNVVPITVEQEIVLVRQFRHGVGGDSLEVPGGVMDAGENPLETAVRELREETGYTGDSPVYLGSSWPNPALQNNRCHFLAVTNCRHSHPLEPDPFEQIEVERFPLESLSRLILEGQVQHALAVNALFLYREWAAGRLQPDAVNRLDGPGAMDRPQPQSTPVAARTARLSVLFAGRVQGVGFRVTTRVLARNYPITGEVENLPDGRVRLEAEGEVASLEEFLTAVSSRMAHLITKTETVWSEAVGCWQEFSIV